MTTYLSPTHKIICGLAGGAVIIIYSPRECLIGVSEMWLSRNDKVALHVRLHIYFITSSFELTCNKSRTQISCMQRKRTNATSKNPRNHSDSSGITDQAALVKVCSPKTPSPYGKSSGKHIAHWSGVYMERGFVPVPCATASAPATHLLKPFSSAVAAAALRSILSTKDGSSSTCAACFKARTRRRGTRAALSSSTWAMSCTILHIKARQGVRGRDHLLFVSHCGDAEEGLSAAPP